MKQPTWREVLRFYGAGKKLPSRSTVRRYYAAYRKESGLSERRCDNEECRFYKEPLVWNGKELDLILDHKDGVARDNHPKSLQLLCPNCESQQPTRGGRNKGRVQTDSEGFSIRRPKGGLRDYTLPTEPADMRWTGKEIPGYGPTR